MWQATYNELTFFGECPHELQERACKSVNMKALIHSPFMLTDLTEHQFVPEFGKLLDFRIWLTYQPEALNIGINPEDLPKAAIETYQKIQVRKYANLWETYLKEKTYGIVKNSTE